jgi:hypothetical protein
VKPPEGARLDNALDMWHSDSWDCPGGKPEVSAEQLAYGLAVLEPWFREEFASEKVRTTSQSVIRQLCPGEAVPMTAPRRYRASKGYIRLRWKVGVRSYVETYEHRVLDGRVTTAEHVHHKNRDKTDNRPENLEHLTADEHAAEHGQEALARRRVIVAMYERGQSIPTISKVIGMDTGAISRHLAAAQVVTRTKSDYCNSLDSQTVAEAYASGIGIKALARRYRVDVKRIRTAIEAEGVALRQPGRPSSTVTGEAAGRRKIRSRSGGMCEVQIVGVCLGRAHSAHHRKNRSQGGTWSPLNLLDTCGDGTRGCHGYITEHPTLAVENGWTVRGAADPAAVPVLRRGVWVRLDDEGGWAAVTEVA